MRLGQRALIEFGRVEILKHIAEVWSVCDLNLTCKVYGDSEIDPIRLREVEEEMRQLEGGDDEADNPTQASQSQTPSQKTTRGRGKGRGRGRA